MYAHTLLFVSRRSHAPIRGLSKTAVGLDDELNVQSKGAALKLKSDQLEKGVIKGHDAVILAERVPKGCRPVMDQAKNTVRLRAPCAPITKDCSISAVLEGPAIKAP